MHRVLHLHVVGTFGVEAAVLCLHVCKSGVVIGEDVGHVDLGRINDTVKAMRAC